LTRQVACWRSGVDQHYRSTTLPRRRIAISESKVSSSVAEKLPHSQRHKLKNVKQYWQYIPLVIWMFGALTRKAVDLIWILDGGDKIFTLIKMQGYWSWCGIPLNLKYNIKYWLKHNATNALK
jgi:hypothetical protein